MADIDPPGIQSPQTQHRRTSEGITFGAIRVGYGARYAYVRLFLAFGVRLFTIRRPSMIGAHVSTTSGEATMAKSLDTKKDKKKAPQKTAKEKKAAKAAKKAAK